MMTINRTTAPTYPALKAAAAYLFQTLAAGKPFDISQPASDLYQAFHDYLVRQRAWERYQDSVVVLQQRPLAQLQLIEKWLGAFLELHPDTAPDNYLPETAALLLLDQYNVDSVLDQPAVKVLSALRGEHPLLEDGSLTLNYHKFTQRLSTYQTEIVSNFTTFQQQKRQLVHQYRATLRLEDFRPKVLTSFVRNRLIDRVYLPLIGDNLAKQMGTADDQTRTDRMGLLLLLSPPGYGKTTLLEYIAASLGLVFVKINGPTLGHQVTSLDPEGAPNRAARQELQKLNLALEMGDNTMLYLDDIQHCHPEFLQKFISLCDAQRRIEGVWKGQSKTYDLRGKRVAVVMAGNPYTESGRKFRIPDMLANRADIYNLGDIIGENKAVFADSYLENAAMSNPTTARLVNRSQADLHTFIKTTPDATNLSLEAQHTPEEIAEYQAVIQKLKAIRTVLLQVNQTYIQSAARDDRYRTEPAFKLQGSYRDMHKLAEKIVPIMNQDELQTLLLTHYENEAQTLTADAEANLLKVKEIMQISTSAEQQRWQEIKATFVRNRDQAA